MKEIIKQYIEPTLIDKYHRYKSWEFCFKAFENTNDTTQNLALHLGFYLASWGMYRGSSGLLWKNYKIHEGAVTIITDHFNLRKNYYNILPPTAEVIAISNELSEYYSGISVGLKKITPTPTLISKIILGTLGCLPALDTYFIKGFNQKEPLKIDKMSLENIWQKTISNKPQIEICQEWIKKETGIWYPPLKIIDMYFWQKGFNNKDVKK